MAERAALTFAFIENEREQENLQFTFLSDEAILSDTKVVSGTTDYTAASAIPAGAIEFVSHRTSWKNKLLSPYTFLLLLTLCFGLAIGWGIPTFSTPVIANDSLEGLPVASPISSETLELLVNSQHHTFKNRLLKQRVGEETLAESSTPTPVPNTSIALAAAAAETSEEEEKQFDRKLLEANTLEVALQQARQEEKRTLLKFGAEWCAPCKIMNKTTLQDPDVKALIRNGYVYVDIDIDDFEGYNLKKQYRVQQVPTVMVLDQRGNIIERHDGAMGTSRLIDLLQTHDPQRYSRSFSTRAPEMETYAER